MKANEAPEKLYIAINELTKDGRTFVLDHRVNYPICTEYTRTDAFIEKAAKWLDETLRNTDFYENEIELMVEGFKKAMMLWK